MSLRSLLHAVCVGLACTLPASVASAQASTSDATPRDATQAERSAVDVANDMSASDPASAIVALESIRARPDDPEHGRAGPALLAAYVTQKRFDVAKTLSQQLLAEPAAPAVEVTALSQTLALMDATADWSAIDAIGPRIVAFATTQTTVPLNQRSSLLHSLMVSYSRMARLKDAERTLDTLIALVGDAPSETLLDAQRARGAIFAQQGRYADAIEALLGAERTSAALGRSEDFGILRNLGGVFINLQEWDRAIEYTTRAELAQRKDLARVLPASRMGVLSMLAAAHIGAGNSEQGHHWSNEAIAFAQANGLPDSGVLNNLAALLRADGRHAEALQRFEEVKAQLSPDDRPETRGVVEKNIGETLIALGQRARAAPHLQAARELYLVADVRPKRLELYPILIDNLEALGQTSQALAAMREFKALSDETVSSESQARIGDLENRIDLERKTKQLLEAEAANELQRAANDTLLANQSRARTTNVGLIVVLVVLVLLLLAMQRNQRIKTRSNRELALRNAEIESQRNALQMLNASIHKQSREDALTGLGNRHCFGEFMAAQRDAAPASTLLIMADLDHFKQINDRHGHAVGDRALCLFAGLLRDVARSNDLVVRWGGEEFVWICRDASIGQGAALCERLLRQLRARPLDVDGGVLQVGVSLGFVQVPVWADQGTGDWDTALRIADHAVYCSKAAGRDCWTGFVGVAAPDDAGAMSAVALEEGGNIVRQRGRACAVAEREGAETVA